MVILLFFMLLNLFYQQVYTQIVKNQDHVITLEDIKSLLENLKNNSVTSVCRIKSYPVNNDSPKIGIPQKDSPCVKKHQNNFVTIINGYIRYKRYFPDIRCIYQCNHVIGESRLLLGKWKNIKSGKPNCDVFEVRCTKVSRPNIIIFQDLHLQIYKRKFPKPPKVNFLKKAYDINNIKNKYNVHIIVIDSISHYMALRGFKKTLNYLEKEYSAVPFKFNNKIGLNSKPNAHAFLLNRRIPILRNFLNLEKVKYPDYRDPRRDACNEYLDKYPFIANYYRQFNYTIFSGEEFKETVFTSAGCKGFRVQYAQHTTRPYVMRLSKKKYLQKNIFMKIHKSKCLGFVKYQFDYLSQFMEAYNDSKQFTYTWITNISHGVATGHYQYDEYFKNFFESKKKLFDNGFLFFMSDHGFRLGKYRYTEIGEFEDKNPFLIIAPPKDLRTDDSEVLKNLKINSNKHTSHFDLYATFLDILTEGSRTNFTNMSNFNFTSIVKNDRIKGESLLRPLSEKRTCYSMEITSEYCLCKGNFFSYNETLSKLNSGKTMGDDIFVKYIKKNFVNELNKILKRSGLIRRCEMFSENNNGKFNLQYLLTSEKKIVFFVQQEVLPKGVFEAYFNENGKIISDNIDRLDKYAEYAEICAPNHRNNKFCYCRNLTKKNREALNKSQSKE